MLRLLAGAPRPPPPAAPPPPPHRRAERMASPRSRRPAPAELRTASLTARALHLAGAVLLLAVAEARQPRKQSAAAAAFVAPVQLPRRSDAWSQAAVSRNAPARVGRISMEDDFYQTLGVARQASEKDIKNAYRQMARKWHPDVNQEPGAKEKFQSINEAYQVLSNPELRARYDQFGMAGVRSGASGPGPGMQDFDLGDIFESFFGGQAGGARRRGPTQGDDLRFDLEIDFKTALFGGSKKIRITHLETCGTCSGSGVAPGASVNTCSTCGGRGVTTQVVNTILGRMQQQVRCPTCGGAGNVVEKYCGVCDGKGVQKRSKQITITIPPGVDDGNRLRVRGEGDAGPKGGPAGDLYVFLQVPPDPRFRRDRMDIFSDVTVSYVDAILGTKIKVPTVDGNVELNIPAGTQPGTTMRIADKGAPKLNDLNVRGSHFVKVQVEIPKTLSSKEKELVMALKEASR